MKTLHPPSHIGIRLIRSAQLACTGLLVLACGSPGALGEAARPADPTAARALGEKDELGGKCSQVSAQARPFLADWKTDQRAELEAAMQSGIAVVHYGCDGIRVLSDCRVKGSYAYASIPATVEERVIEESSDLAGTIPLSAASISADLSRGLKLRLKYALVGRKGAPLPEVLKSDLSGTCEGATHFVRAALVGAFELDTATEGKAGGSAKVLGAGVEGKSRSAREMNRKAGSFDACTSGDDASGPPSRCENLVQLQLAPVVTKASAPANANEDDDEGSSVAETPCSRGYVLNAKGECTTRSSSTAYLCKPGDRSECEAQCAKGSAQSCHNAAGAQFQKGVHADHTKAREAARALYEKGCDGGYLPSCSSLASFLAFDKDGDKTKARQLWERACSGGQANACMSLADAAEHPRLSEDPKKFQPSPVVAFRYTEKACKLGSGFACSQLARRQIEGQGTLADAKSGLATLEKQCSAGNAFTCSEWASYLSSGKSGVTKDTRKALDVLRSTCEKRNYAPACVSAGQLLRGGSQGIAKDLTAARRYASHACENLRSPDGCVLLGRMQRDGELGPADPKAALALFEKACPPNASFPQQGCYDAANLYERGAAGIKKQPELAAEAYARACVSFSPTPQESAKKACKKAVRLLDKATHKSEITRAYQRLCFSHKDQAACAEMKKLSPRLPPPPPPPPSTAQR